MAEDNDTDSLSSWTFVSRSSSLEDGEESSSSTEFIHLEEDCVSFHNSQNRSSENKPAPGDPEETLLKQYGRETSVSNKTRSELPALSMDGSHLDVNGLVTEVATKDEMNSTIKEEPESKEETDGLINADLSQTSVPDSLDTSSVVHEYTPQELNADESNTVHSEADSTFYSPGELDGNNGLSDSDCDFIKLDPDVDESIQDATEGSSESFQVSIRPSFNFLQDYAAKSSAEMSTPDDETSAVSATRGSGEDKIEQTEVDGVKTMRGLGELSPKVDRDKRLLVAIVVSSVFGLMLGIFGNYFYSVFTEEINLCPAVQRDLARCLQSAREVAKKNIYMRKQNGGQSQSAQENVGLDEFQYCRNDAATLMDRIKHLEEKNTEMHDKIAQLRNCSYLLNLTRTPSSNNTLQLINRTNKLQDETLHHNTISKLNKILQIEKFKSKFWMMRYMIYQSKIADREESLPANITSCINLLQSKMNLTGALQYFNMSIIHQFWEKSSPRWMEVVWQQMTEIGEQKTQIADKFSNSFVHNVKSLVENMKYIFFKKEKGKSLENTVHHLNSIKKKVMGNQEKIEKLVNKGKIKQNEAWETADVKVGQKLQNSKAAPTLEFGQKKKTKDKDGDHFGDEYSDDGQMKSVRKAKPHKHINGQLNGKDQTGKKDKQMGTKWQGDSMRVTISGGKKANKTRAANGPLLKSGKKGKKQAKSYRSFKKIYKRVNDINEKKYSKMKEKTIQKIYNKFIRFQQKFRLELEEEHWLTCQLDWWEHCLSGNRNINEKCENALLPWQDFALSDQVRLKCGHCGCKWHRIGDFPEMKREGHSRSSGFTEQLSKPYMSVNSNVKTKRRENKQEYKLPLRQNKTVYFGDKYQPTSGNWYFKHKSVQGAFTKSGLWYFKPKVEQLYPTENWFIKMMEARKHHHDKYENCKEEWVFKHAKSREKMREESKSQHVKDWPHDFYNIFKWNQFGSLPVRFNQWIKQYFDD